MAASLDSLQAGKGSWGDGAGTGSACYICYICYSLLDTSWLYETFVLKPTIKVGAPTLAKNPITSRGR